ncbi:MAG: PAS domain S-box protein [Gemmatirosa sp.]
MPFAPPASAPSVLRSVCETAARALRCPAHVALRDEPAGTTWQAAFDAQGRAIDVDATADAVERLAVPFAGARGTLRFLAPDGGAPWGEAERALAGSFARLAADALAADAAARHRARLAELAQHVDEIQAIAALGSFQWFIAEDRIVWSAEQLRIHGLDAAAHPRDLADFFACIHPDDQPAMKAALEQLMREGAGEWHYRIVRPDGEVRTVHARNSVVRDAEGRAVRVVGTVQDVTRVVAAERELRTANEQLEQRVAERTAALQRSEEHFRRLIEHAHDMIVIIDDDGRPLYGSPSVRRVLGFDPGEVDGTGTEAPYHPDDVPAIAAWVRALGERPATTHRLEYRIRHRDGHWLDMEAVSSVPADYRPGAGHVLNIRDVTERRRAEEELRRSEEHFRTLTENSHDIIVIIDGHTGHIAYQTPSMQRILGYAPEDMAGRNAFAFVHPEDLERVIGEIAGAATHPGTTRHAEYRYRHKDGGWRHLETFGRTLAPTTAEHGLVFNTRDVTERRQAEEALRAEETRYRTLIEQLPAIIYTASLDEGNPTLFTSPHSERLLGFSEAEWRATPRLWLERIHADDRERVEADWNAAHASGRRFAAEYRMVTRDERVLWFRDEAVMLRDEQGRPLHIQGVMLDVTDRREAERALERSNERWRAMIENAHDIVTILDAKGRMGYQSPALTRVLGYTPEELAGDVAFAHMHPEDAPRVVSQLGAVLTNPGSVGHAEYRFRHKDGSWRYLEAFGRTLSPDTAAEGIVANVRDVTERKAAEAALQRSEEYFRRLIENGSDLLAISAVDGPLTYVSPSAERLLGYQPGEMVGKVPDDMVHPDDVPHVMGRLLEIAAAPGTIHHVDFRMRHRDGSWRRFEALARTVASDSADAGIVCNARDVTEQRAAEQALQRSEEHFRRLIENGSDLLMISAPDGALTYVSPSAERLLGFATHELIGRTPTDLVHPDDVYLVQVIVQALAREPGTVREVEFRVQHRDGSWRMLQTIGRTLASDSADEGIVINGRDVTERRAQESALRRAMADAEQAREEAERANHAKSEFLSRMSHELRTPLNSILGFAQVLEDLELPPEYRGGVRHILNGGRHLLNLINEVLDIARIEADEQPMSLEPVRVEGVIREAVDIVRPLASTRGIWVAELPHPAAQRYVRADRQRLTQVLLNLLSNAVKYNRAGGAVRIGCEPVQDAQGRERLRVRVHDEGAGIATEHQGQLFVPFARLGAEHTGVEGTGLGLALSQRLAHAMGGALFLERSGPDGSVFAVDLEPAVSPLAALPIVPVRGDLAAAGVHGTATLLYVEDNLANLSLVETILLPRPEWRVLPALQGRMGLELALQHAPDVVLLDLHLPDMHGRDVLRQLRADPRTADIPVVVISADATPKTIDTLAADGVEAFLTKPLDVRAFLATVDRLLARPRRPRS